MNVTPSSVEYIFGDLSPIFTATNIPAGQTPVWGGCADGRLLVEWLTAVYQVTQQTALPLNGNLGVLAEAYLANGNFVSTARNLVQTLFAATNYLTASGHQRTDLEYVSDLYAAFLDRVPDSPDIAYWAGEVSVRGRAAVCTDFKNAAETGLKLEALENLLEPLLVAPANGANTTYTAQNKSLVALIYARAGSEIASALLPVFGLFPICPNFGTEIETDSRSIVSDAEDNTDAVAYRGPRRKKWTVKLAGKKKADYLLLDAFHAHHLLHRAFYFRNETLTLNAPVKVKFRSELKAQPARVNNWECSVVLLEQ